MHIKNNGFIAVTAVIVIACVTLLFANIIMQIVVDYSGMVMRHEWRIQANLNAESCLNVVTLMVEKNYFLNGEVSVERFECTAKVIRDYVQGSASISVKALFNEVNSGEYEKTFLRY